MIHYRSNQRTKFSFRFPLQIIGLGILTLLIFSVGLYYLRSSQKKETSENETASINFVGATLGVQNNSSTDFAKQKATIKSLSSSLEIGSAERGMEKGILYHTIKISLPEINRETEYYQAWLVRQTPYDFFSTGEMTTNNLGEFVLEWAGEHSEINSYDKVIITREARDNNSSPSNQVAEGQFNK